MVKILRIKAGVLSTKTFEKILLVLTDHISKILKSIKTREKRVIKISEGDLPKNKIKISVFRGFQGLRHVLKY